MKIHLFQNSICSSDDESDFCLKSYNAQHLNGSQTKQSKLIFILVFVNVLMHQIQLTYFSPLFELSFSSPQLKNHIIYISDSENNKTNITVNLYDIFFIILDQGWIWCVKTEDLF